MSKETKTKTGGIVSAVILVLAVVLAMVVCIQVLTRGYVTIAGNSLFRVVTGSMEPTMPVGSILICRDAPIDDIREGDIVCFRSMGSAGVGKIITHRVIAVLQNGDGETLLETRGDANLSADGNYVQADNLIGRVVWYAGQESKLLTFITSRFGFLSCIAIPILLISTVILSESVRSIHKDLQEAMGILEHGPEPEEAPSVELTPEEYREMYERIRKELIEELKHELSEEGPKRE